MLLRSRVGAGRRVRFARRPARRRGLSCRRGAPRRPPREGHDGRAGEEGPSLERTRSAIDNLAAARARPSPRGPGQWRSAAWPRAASQARWSSSGRAESTGVCRTSAARIAIRAPPPRQRRIWSRIPLAALPAKLIRHSAARDIVVRVWNRAKDHVLFLRACWPSRPSRPRRSSCCHRRASFLLNREPGEAAKRLRARRGVLSRARQVIDSAARHRRRRAQDPRRVSLYAALVFSGLHTALRSLRSVWRDLRRPDGASSRQLFDLAATIGHGAVVLSSFLRYLDLATSQRVFPAAWPARVIVIGIAYVSAPAREPRGVRALLLALPRPASAASSVGAAVGAASAARLFELRGNISRCRHALRSSSLTRHHRRRRWGRSSDVTAPSCHDGCGSRRRRGCCADIRGTSAAGSAGRADPGAGPSGSHAECERHGRAARQASLHAPQVQPERAPAETAEAAEAAGREENQIGTRCS